MTTSQTLSRLRITRPSGWSDKLRAYRVLVDGQRAGSIGENETLELAVAPGRHTVQLKIDWCSSPPVDVQVAPHATAELDCGPRFSPVLSLLSVSVFRRRYLRLDIAGAGAPQVA